MARDKNTIWGRLIARALAMLPQRPGDPGRFSGDRFNTQDQREFQHDWESGVGNKKPWAEVRESLDNLR
jgi:hypothetical protein